MDLDDLMNDPVYAQALDLLENGGDIPARVTNKFLAAVLVGSHKSTHQIIRELAGTVGEVKSIADKNRMDIKSLREVDIAKISKEMKDRPALLKLISDHPIRFLGIVAGAVVLGATVWFGFHLLAHIPGVESWLAEILKLPPA